MLQYLQVHTLEISHIIKKDEAIEICKKFQVQYSKSVTIHSPALAGINEIEIVRNPVIEQGIWVRDIHVLRLQVNVGRLLKISNVSMVDLHKSNVQKMIAKLNDILFNDLRLNFKNSNSAEWKLIRLDCGLDVKMDTDDEYVLKTHMQLLHKSFNSANSRGCDYKPYKGYDKPQVKFESITINNDSYTYNIYYKLLEAVKKYANQLRPDEVDEIKNVIRIEKQLTGKGLTQAVGSPRKLSTLLDEDLLSKALNSIVSEMKLLFGCGIHVTYEDAVHIIDYSKYSDTDKLNLKILYANVYTFGLPKTLEYIESLVKQNGGNKEAIKTLIKKRKNQIEALGISVAGLTDDEASHLSKNSLVNINDVIQDMFKAKSARPPKAKFCRIRYDATNKRYKCNPTLHNENGNKKRLSIAGKTVKEVEMNVLQKIKINLNNSLRMNKNDLKATRDTLLMTLQDVENFKTVVDRPDMIAILEDVLFQLNNRLLSVDKK
jgi:hypothetical protein